MQPIVEMKNITKVFGFLTANDSVNFQLNKGEIHALLGENGAGKTTLMKILYGFYQPTSGEIWIKNEKTVITSPKDAIKKGIGMVNQHFALVPSLTVAENIVLGYTEQIFLDQKSIENMVSASADKFGISIDPRSLVRNLSVGERQKVEILKALFRNAEVVILDEPTAVLIPQEIDILFDTLNRLRRNGLSFVFISHKLNEVVKITDRVSILRDGKLIDTVNTGEVNPQKIAAMMVGRESFAVKQLMLTVEEQNTVLKVSNLNAKDNKSLPALKNINLNVNSGEIVGIAGVSGNGQKELVEVLNGVKKPESGSIFVNGIDLAGKSPNDFTKNGVGRIPEDRHEGVVGDLTVMDNLALEFLDEYTRHGVLDRKKILSSAIEIIEKYQIKAKPTDRIRTLSGGNMQKVLLARVLSREPELIIAPQPTRGLDIGATNYIRNQLLDQKNRGAAVLLISDELDEILSLADRIAVLFQGEIVGVINTRDTNPELLGLMMSGAYKEVALNG